MAAKSRKASKAIEELPPGLSPAEEAEWWDAHPDYWDQIDFEDEVVGPLPVRRTKAVNLRLPEDLIAALQREAARRAVSYQTLIETWLEERLAVETKSS